MKTLPTRLIVIKGSVMALQHLGHRREILMKVFLIRLSQVPTRVTIYTMIKGSVMAASRDSQSGFAHAAALGCSSGSLYAVDSFCIDKFSGQVDDFDPGGGSINEISRPGLLKSCDFFHSAGYVVACSRATHPLALDALMSV